MQEEAMLEPGPTLTALLTTERPERLYHYTSIDGLEGIVTSKSLWASAAQYLNDAKEFKLALDIARRQLRSEAHSESHEGRSRLLEYLADQIERGEDLEICVFSLSKEGDLLSQWRGYCPPSGGYSIGFWAEELKSVTASQEGILAPCEYDHNRHEALVREALTPLMVRLPTNLSASDEEIRQAGEEMVGLMFSQLCVVAPLIKHPSFREEHEWRLIWIPGRGRRNPLRYRKGGGTFIPYVEFKLEHGKYSCSLSNIIIGPMSRQEQAFKGLAGFLHQSDMKCGSILFSSTPYRTW